MGRGACRTGKEKNILEGEAWQRSCNLSLLSGLIKFSSVKFDFVVKGNPSHVVLLIGSFPQSFRGRDNIVQAFGFVTV